jgi:hypothetical protein
LDIEQTILKNIRWIDGQALFIFEQVFGRKLEEERSALGHTFIELLSESSVALGGPVIIECSIRSLEGSRRAKTLVETGNRAKAAKQMILRDLSVVSICLTAATKALGSGDPIEAINSTMTASRAIGIAEADLRQLRLAQHKTGMGGHQTQRAHKRNTEGDEEKVLTAWKKLSPRPPSANRAADLLVQAKIGVSHRKAAKFIAAAMRSEKAGVLSQPTE